MSDTSDPDSEEYDSDEMEDGVGVAATVIAPTDVKATIEELRRKQLSDAQQVASVELAAKKARAAAAEAAAARFEAASRAAAELARNPPPIVQGSLPPPLQLYKDKLLGILRSLKDPMKNTPPLQEQCINTLRSICQNAIANPSDPKFRKIKCLNKTIASKVSNCLYGEDFLVQCGFLRMVELNEGFFVCGAETGAVAGTTDLASANFTTFNGKISKKIEVAVQCPVAIVRRLEIAEDVLGKASALAVEKTERWDREKHREKNEVQAQKDRAKEAIKDDKERRRVAEERKRYAATAEAAAAAAAAAKTKNEEVPDL